MPEVHVNIEWPGQVTDKIYSPSTIIDQYLKPGDEFTLVEFESRITLALEQASMRVYERFGYECTSAMAELERVKGRIAAVSEQDGLVKIL